MHLFPYVESDAVTKEFLQKLFEILFMFIQETNDRDMKVLNFKHPEEMFKHLDLEIPEQGKSLQTLLEDCHTTLKNQVRTGRKQYRELCVPYASPGQGGGRIDRLVRRRRISGLKVTIRAIT
ncbi:hypothetical protein RUM44_006415 [Polyplax serrata]|uniref:Uncharacterized protein n=1 Tax=Polyplax serrata TaxID=468196 RepID=A0ABR1AI20_POLSC